MISKIRSSAIASILVMLFLGVACGENLLLGGIDQEKPVCAEPCSSYTNTNYKAIAAGLGADYIPMYYEDRDSNVNEVRKAALGEATEQNGLENGALKNHHYETIVAYSGGTSTAVTALADKAKYGLTCDTLILVSPMAAAIGEGYQQFTEVATGVAAGVGGATAAGGTALVSATNPIALAATPLTVPAATLAGGVVAGGAVGGTLAKAADIKANWEFQDQIKAILQNNPNLKIIVIQSPEDDKPTLFSGVYQYTFKEDDTFKEYKSRIQIVNAELTSTGETAHKELFFDYAKDHLELKDGEVDYSSQPISQKTSSAFSKNPWSNSKLAQWGIGSPMLSPTSDTSGLSGQNKEGTDETSGTSYINKAKNDAWYVDMNSPTFVNEIAYFNPAFDWAVKPPAPMYLPSGELNTYGYDFIHLPGMGDYFTDMYLNWVGTYLNSIGGGANGGYGLLLDEDRNVEGGW